MRRFILKICLILLAAPAATALRAQAQTSYLDRIEWVLSDVTMVSDSAGGERTAKIDLAIKWKDKPHASTQHAVSIVPALISKDSTEEFYFSPIYIYGKIREKATEREAVLNRRDTSVTDLDSVFILETGRKAPSTVRYVGEIPYNPAMLDGCMALYETVHGCADCLEGTDTMYLAEVLPPYQPQWSAAPDFIQSPSGNDKHRERRHRANLNFIINRYEIRPDYMDNAEALDEIVESIRTAMNDTLFTVKAVRFLGFASPDGPERFNISLARNRAAALADHVKGMDTSIPDSLYVVENGAENWDGFFKAVAADPELASNETVLRVRNLLREDNRDSCERILKQDKALYEKLKTDILPDLRLTEYVIEYNLRDFSPEEAEALWEEHPDWLSINEMYSVAELYGEDDPRYLDVLFEAATTYPTDVAAVHNAAIALYRKGMTDEAFSLLTDRYEPELLNTLGILYASEDMNQEAINAFSLAAKAGHEGAAHNLEELQKVMEQL